VGGEDLTVEEVVDDGGEAAAACVGGYGDGLGGDGEGLVYGGCLGVGEEGYLDFFSLGLFL